MRNRVISSIILLVIISGCASLTRNQVDSVNAYSKLLNEYTAYPGLAVTELIDLEYEATLLNTGTYNDNKVNEQLWKAYELRKRSLEEAKEIDLSINILGEYAAALVKLSSRNLGDSIGISSQLLGTNIDSLITQYNANPNTVKKIPSGIGALVREGITFIGSTYTKEQQGIKLKQYVKEGNEFIPILTDAITAGMNKLIIGNGITNLKHKIENNQTSLLMNMPTSPYKAYYANEYNKNVAALIARTDKLEILAKAVIAAVEKIQNAHQQLNDSLREKKKIMSVLSDTQALFVSVRNLNRAYRQINK